MTDVISIGENLTINVKAAQLDDNTKLLLEVAIGLLLSAWAGSAVLAFFKSLRDKVTSGVSSLERVGVSFVFWCVVLVATYNLAKA